MSNATLKLICRLTDVAVTQVARACTRLRYVDFAGMCIIICASDVEGPL